MPKLVFHPSAISSGSAPTSRAAAARAAPSGAVKSSSAHSVMLARLRFSSSSARRVRSGMGPMEAALR
jgi:hypothetical protein